MMIDYADLCKHLIKQTVLKPVSGTLSGHAAGEPFEKIVNAYLKTKHKGITFKQFEFLNELYLANPKAITVDQKYALIKEESLQHLLCRGASVTNEWSKSNLFEEKQDDTADTLIVEKGKYEIIDVKTTDIKKKAQPPNIVSALKIAEMCKLMLDNSEYDILKIVYVGIDWELKGNTLECVGAEYKHLFKADPSALYINWSAALQIQFQVHKLDQSFKGSQKEWCAAFLKNFVKQAKARVIKMQKDWIDKYQTY